jgi:hypothetical protein
LSISTTITHIININDINPAYVLADASNTSNQQGCQFVVVGSSQPPIQGMIHMADLPSALE